EWFQAFADGIKTVELRPYGKRWNERVCREGREVTLSKGYGKAHRLRGVINLFRKMRADELLPGHRKAILDCYGTLDMDVAVIGIQAEKEPAETAPAGTVKEHLSSTKAIPASTIEND
ncbi:MAG: hypothetical protein R6W92_02370, partial [Desulfocurvibacter africanus]